MGVCPSRCGEKQPPPGADPAATDAAAETKLSPSLLDPNHSLKRFLHLNQDPKTSSAASPPIAKSSFMKSAALPHSSELFSLPSSEHELRSSFALSPTETSKPKAPGDVALLSSHFTLKSPSKGRNNNHNSKRITRPATRGAAHQRLVDAIARLERLNDSGKASLLGFLVSEDVPPAPKSSTFGDSLNKPVMRSRHVSHYHLPLRQSTMATAPSSHPVSLDKAPADTDFLRQTFVSLIEKPRKLDHPKATFPATGSNRCSLGDVDGEEMFSLEFGPSEERVRLKQSPVRKKKKSVSLQRLMQSGTPRSSSRGFAGGEVAMASVESEKKSSCSTWQPVEVFVEHSRTRVRTAKARVSGESSAMKSLRKEEGAVAARPAQDRNVNLVAMRKAKSPRLALRLKALKGLRRGRLPQSLDSTESSVIHDVDLEIFRNQGSKPNSIAANRLSTVAVPKKHATEGISIDAKGVELERLPVPSRLEPPGCEQKLKLKENCCSRISDTSTTTKRAAVEILPPQEVSLVEDPIPSTGSADSSPREPAGNLEKVPDTKETRCEETLPCERTECTGSEPPAIVSKVVLALNSGCSQWLGLVETFRSLLRLLFFFMTDQAGAECKSATKLTIATTPGPVEDIQHEWG